MGKNLLLMIGIVLGVFLGFLLVKQGIKIHDLERIHEQQLRIQKELPVPDDFGKTDDALRGVVSELLLNEVEELNENIYGKEFVDSLRVNTLLLGKNFSEVHEMLGAPTSSPGFFAQGNTYVLEAYDVFALSGISSAWESISLLAEANESYTLSIEINDGNANLQEKIEHNKVASEMISLQIYEAYVKEKFDGYIHGILLMKQKISRIEDTISQVGTKLGEIVFLDPEVTQCMNDFLSNQDDYLERLDAIAFGFGVHQGYINESRVLCNNAPYICHPEHEVIRYLDEQTTALSSVVDSLGITYETVGAYLASENEQGLLEWCEQESTLHQETIEFLEDILGVASPEIQDITIDQDEQENEGVIGQYMNDPQWSNYLLEDIKKSQELWFKEKQGLESDSKYIPNSLLDDMFDRFDGNTDDFLR